MRFIAILLFLGFYASVRSQECSNALPIVEPRYGGRIQADSVYRLELQNAIQFYVELNCSILPRYYRWRERLKSEIKKKDRALIQELDSLYYNQCQLLLNELESTHNRLFKNMAPYAKLHVQILMETFKTYPDTYALIFNEHLLKKQTVSPGALTIKKRLVDRYGKLFEENVACLDELDSAISESMNRNNVAMPFQAHGIDDALLRQECRILNLLLWANTLE